MSIRKEIPLYSQFNTTMRRKKILSQEIDNMVKITRASVQSRIKNFNLPDSTFNKPISGRPT